MGNIKFGPDEGNSGALFRWGDNLDNGVWLLGFSRNKLWLKPKFMRGYIRLGFVVIRFYE